MEGFLVVEPAVELFLCGVAPFGIGDVLCDVDPVVDDSVEFFDLVVGDVFGGFGGGAAFGGVAEDIDFLEVLAIGIAHEGTGAGDVFDETFRGEAVKSFADRGEGDADFGGEGAGDESFAWGEVAADEHGADLGVGFLGERGGHVDGGVWEEKSGFC